MNRQEKAEGVPSNLHQKNHRDAAIHLRANHPHLISVSGRLYLIPIYLISVYGGK